MNIKPNACISSYLIILVLFFVILVTLTPSATLVQLSLDGATGGAGTVVRILW